MASAAGSNRSAWPVSRFVKTLLFFSPLGRLARSKSADPAYQVQDVRRRKRTPKRKPVRAVILVTGATGGTGRRVVRDLLAAPGGRVVRALTRSRERLVEALATVGVDAEKEVADGRLEIAVADLYTINDRFFKDVVGVASCTGVKVGPPDDPDQSKNSVVILEDTPENVEYVGVRNLVEAAKMHFSATSGGAELPVMTFTGMNASGAIWGALDDVVMGGVSKGNVRVQDGSLVFGGFVSTDNSGGFSSARTVNFKEGMNIGDYDGFSLRVKGDGKNYKFIVRCEQKWDGVGYCYTFPTTNGEWTDVRIPFSDFKPVFRAKSLRDGKPLDPTNIFAFQVMLSKFEYDGELNPNFSPGPFELRIESIKAYRESAGPVTPKIVHVGSAGVTRVLRTDEFDIATQPPAVRLNDNLGRILDWKLAGEDVIRQSGIPYFIVRPCALTEKKPLGVDSLSFKQGDTLMGQVSRDDISPLIVSSFENEKLVNVTTEVSWKKEEQEDVGPFLEQIEGLQQDREEQRRFTSFPYVPVEDRN